MKGKGRRTDAVEESENIDDISEYDTPKDLRNKTEVNTLCKIINSSMNDEKA